MSWIEFEIWIDDDVSIQGYMNLEDANDDEPLQFYDYNGLECGSKIHNTKYPNFSEDQAFKWDVLCQWMAETDLVQTLVDFSEKEIIAMYRAESDFGRIFDVELYINCSKFGGE